MSIEIDILNGSGSWPTAEPLFDAIWPPQVLQQKPWGHLKWAHADLRVLIEAPSGGLACHVGIYFRTVSWNGRKVHIGGIGGVMTREDCRGRGYASIALNAAVQTLRDHDAVQFALLFCEPHHFGFYQARGWQPFSGDILAEQPGGKIRYDALAPLVFEIRRAPRQGTIDLCGLPW
jgi:predicted acetyltransferase